MRNALPALVLLLLLGGPVKAACPEGDLFADCRINSLDLKVMADLWLDGPGSPANLVGQDEVNMADFSVIAMHWGEVGERTGSVEVEITPKAAINLGAKWRVDGGPWQDTGQRLDELEVGFNTIEFKSIDIWAKPADAEIYVNGDLITAVRAAYKHPLEINEFMASNSGNALNPPEGNAKDEHGEYDDWIEIFNSGDEAIDAAGMHLRDGDDNEWEFPGNNPLTTIAPGGYLLIWADDWTDNDVNDGPLHTNFKLSAGGDKISLYDTDDESLIDSVDFGDQTNDISYGRDASDNWRFFPYPSPGWENNDAYLGAVADTKFSHNRGFYDTQFSVTIATETKGATIKYTTNDSAPSESETVGQEYTGPVPVNTTTCLRAMAFKTGWKPTDVDTHTYIFLDNVIDHPKMSTNITQNPVWGPQMRDALLEIPTISLVTPHTIPNEPIQSPPEVPTSIEMIFPDGRDGFQANACVERFGGQYTDHYLKQALRISFKSIYGPSRLEFDLFGDTPYGGDDATDSFNQIILRNGSHDALWYGGYPHSKGTYVRNRYCFDRQIEMGHLSLRGKFVHMYLNGVYWGQYHLMERPTADYMATYLGGEEEDYDIMKGRSGIFVAEGDRVAWNYMVANTNNYEIVQEYMDIDNYIDYMLLNFYGGNDHDWYPHHNWIAGRRREAGNKFMFFMWDNDFLMRRLNGNTIDNGGPGNMLNSLTRHEDFKIRLADRAQKHFFNDGMLTPTRVQADFTELTNRIARTIIPECARWSQDGSGGTYTPDSLQQYVDWIKFDHGNLRTDIVIQQMRDAGIFPSIDAPTFSRHGGEIAPSEPLSMTAPAGAIWYTINGADPRVITGGGGSSTTMMLVDEEEAKTVLIPTETGPGDDTWRSDYGFDDRTWISGSGGVGYDRGSDYNSYIDIDVKTPMAEVNTSCYIRIPFTFAGDPSDFNYMTLKMRYDDGFIAYLNGTKLEEINFSGEPEWNSEADTYREATAEFDNFDISAHLGELQTGNNLLAIHGLNDALTSSDFLMCIELEAGENTPGNVSDSVIEYTGPINLTESTCLKARALSSRTWSALNEAVFAVGPVAESLRITEIMYHPQDTGNPNDPNEEFIELKNIGEAPINLNLVRFTNGIDFTFGKVELGAGEYVLVVKNHVAFDPQYPGFSGVIAGEYTGSLDNGGERIELADAVGRTIQDFKYGDDWRPITDGEGFSLTIIDPANGDPNSWGEKDSWRASAYSGGSPGSDDSGIIPNPGDVVINELLAHSPGT
ncbi:MAG: lamin tail domain-containing protein, partial [Planctomycetes bacterium]|nr:lamin tail domain-containing protein [Planctomycetota bacterium]